jgi:hypothetical protein
MKFIYLLLLIVALQKPKPTTVYVCKTPNVKKYHYRKDCRGLSHCTYKIIKTTQAEAEKNGKTLCGWEK